MAIESNFWIQKRLNRKDSITPIQPVEGVFDKYKDDLAQSNKKSFEDVMNELSLEEDEEEDEVSLLRP